MKKLMPLLITFMLLTACQQVPDGGSSTATESPSATLTPVPTITETSTPILSENPSAQELFAAKQGEMPDVFTFGGHEWTATENQNGEKVWTREDGKVNLEWVDDLYGGRHPSYMFVARSEQQVGKRNLEIYTDPRYPVFDIITGTPSQIDVFVGQTVANVMESDAAQTVLRQPGSTLKIVIGGIENWPIGNDSGKPQTIYYTGSNGESLSQKIWGFIDPGKYEIGSIGPFIDQGSNDVQCAIFTNTVLFDETASYFSKDSNVSINNRAAAIGNCIHLDPKKSSVLGDLGFHSNALNLLIESELIK